MKINRDNYEIFFLDYFENELPAEKVAELFLFIENNPDLKAEFEAYKSTQLPSLNKEEFSAKDLLKKPVIDNENAEEYMLRSLDYDLSKDEELSLQRFINANPLAKKQFELLKKTVLKAEKITYAHKLDLRKKGVDLYNYQTYLIADLEGELSIEQKKELEDFLEKNPLVNADKTLMSKTILPAVAIEYPDKSDLKKAIPLYSINFKWVSYATAACIALLIGIWLYNPVQNDQQQIAQANDSNSSVIEETKEPVSGSQDIKNEQFIADNTTAEEKTNDDLGAEDRSSPENIDNGTEDRFDIRLVNQVKRGAISNQAMLACEKLNYSRDRSFELENSREVISPLFTTKPDAEMIALIQEFYGDDDIAASPQQNSLVSDLAEQNLKKLADDSYVAATMLDKEKRGGRKLFELVASGISKVSNDKMRLNGRFNDQDELVAYSLRSNKVNVKNNY